MNDKYTDTCSKHRFQALPFVLLFDGCFIQFILCASNYLHGLGKYDHWSQRIICIVLTTSQCYSRDEYTIPYYSVANAEQCDVIAHTRGKVSDVVAVP